MMAGDHAYLTFSPADPAGSGALVAAVQWLQALMLGTLATTVAVICVAAFGLMMLSGRMDLRRSVPLVMGCFILFGASTIAAGIHSIVRSGSAPAEPLPAAQPPPLVIPPPPPSPPAPADPYAGAAVPSR